ncbi:MAG TPA: anion transporter, partial [Casimicrobiaceae bacterium]|nr:anion transporter [Casimicrobiaceae bacterium]
MAEAVAAEGTYGKIDRVRHAIGVPLAIVLAAAVWSMKTPEGLSPEGHKALALFTGIFVLYLTEAIPLAISSLLVVPVAVLIGLA